jgi:excisionase family DNA binding protein
MSEPAEKPQKKERVKLPNSALTVAEVADRLWINRSSARRLIIEGQIPSFCVRSGKRKHSYRVRPEILERWISAKERENQRAKVSLRNGNGAIIEATERTA